MYIPLGDGKTHYIKKHLHQPYLVIAVNESFSLLNAIVKLRSLPRNESCTIFFNFTIVPSIVSSSVIITDCCSYSLMLCVTNATKK